MAFVEKKKEDLVYMQSTLIPFPHAFSTRYGGVSKGGLATLNFGTSRGDDPECVRENYARFCSIFGCDENSACVTNQIHSNIVLPVTKNDVHRCLGDVPYEADGLVTGEKHLPVCCFTADCVPALLADKKGRAAAAVHCGWKGSCADIIGEAVSKMVSLGAKPEDICCAFGPAIGRCCFETDGDVPEAISRWLHGETDGIWTRREDGKYLVDLRKANAIRLNRLGILPENIDISEECTVCLHEKYWSHRYTKKRGLMRGNSCAMIMLE